MKGLETYKTAGKASSEEYIASSIIRFGRLRNYIQEKLLVDYFAIKGNLMMIKGLEEYIQKNLAHLKSLDRIRILDVGPAIGAVSTMLALQSLDKYGLLDKAQVYLIDVSENVITLTQTGKFIYPGVILDKKLKGKIMKKLRESKSAICSAEKIPWENESFNITLACFVFHHLHNSIKALAASEVTRTLAPNGFLGIAEEWFRDYSDYASKHLDDQISLAYESLISYRKLSRLFPSLNVFFAFDKQNRTNSYAFCAEKQ